MRLEALPIVLAAVPLGLLVSCASSAPLPLHLLGTSVASDPELCHPIIQEHPDATNIDSSVCGPKPGACRAAPPSSGAMDCYKRPDSPPRETPL
jgi:hypothetical protein